MNDQSTLQAGGIVPTSSKLGAKEDAVDTVVARAYVHPVMPARTIVRLCAEGVAAGDELEMSTLGFGEGEERGAVGKERRRPLGFPGWCLVNDPKNARYALDVVKELKKHARKAKSKPGHAKDAFDAIAAKLSKTVPHFLPSFYEEVGRVFIEHGAITYASQMFGKARQVEAVHALEVDEQHRIDGFLEFALAGAVTTKALSEYGKELSEHHEPKAAYAHFRQLCVQRTLGGMPPWSGMAKDLGRLAKAAKLDTDKEDAALIAEIIESPALAKAAGEFWRAYAEPMTELAKANPSARGTLLNLFPTGNTNNPNPELDDTWLDILEASGAFDALIGDGAPEVQPLNGRAAWFDKLCGHTARGYRSKGLPTRVYTLLRRMAPALIADGKPIKGQGRYTVDLDLAELALELGVAVEPPHNWSIDANHWASHASEPERGRDPVRCAAHPRLSILLQAAVESSLGHPAFDAASAGKAGFLTAKRQWLERVLDLAESGALPAVEAALKTIGGKVRAVTFAELPDLYARFCKLDVAPALARTLQVGILDEYGWPALEAVMKELRPDANAPLVWLHGGPAALVVATATKAVAIAGEQRKGEHDLVIPPKHEVVAIRYIGDQFLVVLKEGYNQIRAYWSSAPQDLISLEGINQWALSMTAPTSFVQPDGAWCEGTRPIRPGDRVLPIDKRLLSSDGTTSWMHEYSDGKHRWREYNQAGEAGRFSWPPWIEAHAADGWSLDTGSHYLPVHVTASPLGVANGFSGVRIRTRQHEGKHERAVETIDGATFHGSVSIEALLAFPDGGERRPLDQDSVYGQHAAISIYDPTGRYVGSRAWGGDSRYARGQAAATPLLFLHNYTARDAAGSKRLHAATSDDARALIAASPLLEEWERPSYGAPKTPEPKPPEDLPGLLPEITDTRLRTGIASIAAVAKQLEARRDKLIADRDPSKAEVAASLGPDDDALEKALPGWLRNIYSSGGSAWTQIERTAAAFANEDRTDRIATDFPGSPLAWFELALMRAALPVLAVAIGTPEKSRPLVAQLHEHLHKLPPLDKLRLLRTRGLENANDQASFQVRWVNGNVYALRRWGYSGDVFEILEYAPSGVFALPATLTVDSDVRGVVGGPTVEETHAAVAAGSTSWSPEAAATLSAETGLTPSEATYLWAGCPSQTDRNANFMDKELREQLDLKAAQAQLARDALNVPRFFYKIHALAELGRGGLAAVLDGSGVRTLATAWKAKFGERVSIPESLITEADEQGLSTSPATVLGWILDDESPQLTVDGTYAFDPSGALIRASKPEPLVGQTKLEDSSPHFDLGSLQMLVLYLPFLFAELPVGAPLRAQAVVAYELALKRLENPALWFNAASTWVYGEQATQMKTVIEGLGGELVPGTTEGHVFRRLHGGAVTTSERNISVHVRPVEFDAKARAVIAPLAQQVSSYTSTLRDLDYLRGDDLAAMMKRIGETPVPDGGWEQNPLLSCSKLVDKVQKELKLSREAAALYLQYLVLLWPTPKALAEYNGWKPKQVGDAQAELVDKELLLEAKRERAQRTHFLPGGWEALKSPHPPMETWKQKHIYPVPGAKYQAKAPFHVLFERAWKVIEDGEAPRYDEVKR